jgi:hypothetical protein
MIYKGNTYQLLPGASDDFQYGFREDEEGFVQTVVINNGRVSENVMHRNTMEHILAHLEPHKAPVLTADEAYFFGVEYEMEQMAVEGQLALNAELEAVEMKVSA